MRCFCVSDCVCWSCVVYLFTCLVVVCALPVDLLVHLFMCVYAFRCVFVFDVFRFSLSSCCCFVAYCVALLCWLCFVVGFAYIY